jgi:hypothetical protein
MDSKTKLNTRNELHARPTYQFPVKMRREVWVIISSGPAVSSIYITSTGSPGKATLKAGIQQANIQFY